MTAEWRNDDAVQEAARNLFVGIVPERQAELAELWAKYEPRFNVLDELGKDGRFIMDAGLYHQVRFNHRAMRAFWLAAYIAWEGHLVVKQVAKSGHADHRRFMEMIEVFRAMIAADDSTLVPLPPGVPEPGIYPTQKDNPDAAAPAQLATLAAGWGFLHEIRHLRHQHEGTGAPYGASPAENHKEELSCDAFAITFLLEKAADYAAQCGEDVDKVRTKRSLGIYSGLFCLALLGGGHWGDTNLHPALQRRIDAAVALVGSRGDSPEDVVARMAFGALRQLWPDAPTPFA